MTAHQPFQRDTQRRAAVAAAGGGRKLSIFELELDQMDESGSGGWVELGQQQRHSIADGDSQGEGGQVREHRPIAVHECAGVTREGGTCRGRELDQVAGAKA